MKNKIVNTWIYSANNKVKILPDEDFNIHTLGEMVEVDMDYLAQIINRKQLNLLVQDVEEIKSKLATMNDLNNFDEAIINEKKLWFKNVYFTIWQHSGILNLDSELYNLLVQNNLLK